MAKAMGSGFTLTSSFPDNGGTQKSWCYNERQSGVQGGIMIERPHRQTGGPPYVPILQASTRHYTPTSAPRRLVNGPSGGITL